MQTVHVLKVAITPGPELDAEIAALFGIDIPTREQAMIAVALRHISCTGHPFRLDDDSEVHCPPGATLPPTEDGNFNNRYAIYIAQQREQEWRAEFDAYHLKADLISTDPAAAFRALEIWRGQKMRRGWECTSPILWSDDDKQRAAIDLVEDGVIVGQGRAPTFPHAAALALRAALGDSQITIP